MTDLRARIRAALGVTGEEAERRAAVEAHLKERPTPPMPAYVAGDAKERMAELVCRLEGHQASVAQIAGRGDAPEAIADWLAGRNLPPRAVIAPALADRDWSPLETQARAPRSEDAVGISEAALGVAETGSLVLYAGPEEPLTLAFMPEFHIVLLAAEAIVGPLEAVWEWQRRRFPERPPQALTLVSGPSRTADIEQTMYLGAHGPRALHVLIYGAG